MRRLRLLVLFAGAAALIGLFVTRPVPLPPSAIEGLVGDSTRGALVFAAAGCASCHHTPDTEAGILAGGRAFASDFGTFYAPNITPDPDHGIGGWSDLELASAIMRGVGRSGEHLYPAFPYTTYARAEPADIVDLIAYLRTLPAAPTPSRAHDVGFPFNIRASLGGWKMLFMRTDWIAPDMQTDEQKRGQYLVEALGHCGECHTPRNTLGGTQTSRWLKGAANPSGEGRIPDITPSGLGWSASEITEYLTSGFTPEFDTAGGEMVEVVENMAQLPDSDRAAIAAYLVALPE